MSDRERVAAIFREAMITSLRDYDVPEELPKNDPDLSDAANAYADAAIAALGRPEAQDGGCDD